MSATTTDASRVPVWLDLDAIHPPEELAKVPAVIEAARGVLDAVAAFNREHLATIHAYYERENDHRGLPDDLSVAELTGMDEADGLLMLAAYILTRTVVGQGEVTYPGAAMLLDRHAATVEGVKGLYRDPRCTLPVVGDGADQ